MSRNHKKRNKPYTGADAANRPVVHRYQAVMRSPLGEWWHDHKKQVRVAAIVAAVALAVIFIGYELIDLVF